MLISLGSVIRHYAVLDGIRDLKKSILKEWAIEYRNWLHGINTQLVFQKYFNFITDNTLNLDFLDNLWQKETRLLLDTILE